MFRKLSILLVSIAVLTAVSAAEATDYCTIRGRVFHRGLCGYFGPPAAGVRVHWDATDTRDGNPGGYTKTESGGYFSIRVPAGHRYQVHAVIDGYASSQTEHVEACEAGKTYQVILRLQ